MYLLGKEDRIVKVANSALVDLPTPANISGIWNFGSLLGLVLSIQLITGIFLALQYSCHVNLAFERVDHIIRDVSNGWFLRYCHANGASFFFIFLYLHAGRGIYYGSYNYKKTWLSGVVILLLVQATAFLGYVLPWGQISFWGATVITNLVSSIPVAGDRIVQWLWGGFSVDNSTLTRFFAFHFLMPFIIAAIAGAHLVLLHETGSNNPLGLSNSNDKIPFHPYFRVKDLIGFYLFVCLFIVLVNWYPNSLGDPENFIPANSLVTPVHIQPEWYFLFAYAILRAVPNKLGGVIALVLAILILMILPFTKKTKFSSLAFYPVRKVYFWSLVARFVLLTLVGAKPVEEPYIFIGQLLRVYYFGYFLLSRAFIKAWDILIKK